MTAPRKIVLAALTALAFAGSAAAQQDNAGNGGDTEQNTSGAAGGGAGGETEQAGGGAAAPQMPPPDVTVQTVESRTIPITYEYAARVAASREVEVRARVAGIILERTFEEGSRVAANQTLFRIDPREYQAQVQQAQAAVQQALAQVTIARRTEERQQSLVRSGATSTATVDEAVANRELAEAQLASANAQLFTANLSLNYATVNAPVGGITSLEQFPEGSLVSVNTLLTRISQLDPIYVNFSAADTEAMQIRRLIQSGTAYGANRLVAEVVFGDGSTYDQVGSIDFTSATIDTNTGTISSRAVFPNSQQQLLPGQFVRIAIRGLSLDDAIEIPATALMQNPSGQYVFTIGANNVAEVRPITVGREMNERIVVASGLKAGDRVVTQGVVKVRPGAPVNPTAAPAETVRPAPDDTPAPAADSGTGSDLGSGVEARGPAQGQGGGPVDDTGSNADDRNVGAGQSTNAPGGGQ